MSESLKEKVLRFFRRRRVAYAYVFNPESEATKIVLNDLAKFCRANSTTFHSDPRVHAVLEGRREVFLRIMHHTQLDPDQFWKEHGRDDIT
jgi:hypothetical protein